MVIVHGPAPIGHDVRKLATRANIILREDVIADVATVFPLSRQGSDWPSLGRFQI